MSELVAAGVGGGALPTGPPEKGSVYHNGAPRGPQGRAPAASGAPTGVLAPTVILRNRRDREARKKAEEAKERERQELERIRKHEQELEKIQSERLAQSERNQQAAGVAGEPARRPGMGSSHPPDVALPQDPALKHDQIANPGATAQYGELPTGGQRPEPQRAGNVPHDQAARQQARTSTTHAAPHDAGSAPQAPKAQAQSKSSQQSQSQQQQQSRSRPSFPHAFERWEMLSSHWEGLTSYWIRRLEENNEEMSRDPLSQQMSRQVTDLSAAGANLFHAVVELQRLRASSERKFQRWFFDTRAEQERAHETQAELDRQLKVERQGRTDAIAALKQAEIGRGKAEELAKEMRRELQISRDEARRAWEELGRREQEERDRTMSLRNGEPTIVGGVQVVPMVQAMSGRHGTNRPPTREGPYPGGPGATTMGGQTRPEPQGTPDQYGYDSQVSSPTETDPFTEPPREQTGYRYESSHSRQPASTARGPASQTQHGVPTSSAYSQPTSRGEDGRFYQHGSQSLQVDPAAADDSDTVSEDPDTPTARTDAEGRRIIYPRTISEDSDEYEDEAREHERPLDSRYGLSSYRNDPPGTEPEDLYSGSGWGAGSGWDSITPRHRHPTRLSDVLEEDERSRTSASRASQISRTLQ